MSPGDLFLVLSFSFLPSLGYKFSLFCSLSPAFLGAFRQSNTLMFLFQDV